jgi:hypothetical protein
MRDFARPSRLIADRIANSVSGTISVRHRGDGDTDTVADPDTAR